MSLQNFTLGYSVDVPGASDVLPGYMPYLIYNNMFGASNVLPILKFSGLRFESLHDPLEWSFAL